MAVVDYRVNGEQLGVRSFMVPKRAAELKYWYKAAKSSLPCLPDWQDWMASRADITVETIIIDWENEHGVRHIVSIARKRQLI